MAGPNRSKAQTMHTFSHQFLSSMGDTFFRFLEIFFRTPTVVLKAGA